MGKHVAKRAYMKQMLLCVLEPSYVDMFGFQNLPSCPLSAKTIQALIEVFEFIDTYQRKFFYRTQIYAIALICLYVIQMLYLYL